MTTNANINYDHRIRPVDERSMCQTRLASDEASYRQNQLEMIGESAKLKHTLQRIQIVGPTDATVLILGETGTGKEGREKWPFGAACLHRYCYPAGMWTDELSTYYADLLDGSYNCVSHRFECLLHALLFGWWVPHLVAQAPRRLRTNWTTTI